MRKEMNSHSQEDYQIFLRLHESNTNKIKLLVKSLESENATKEKIPEPVAQKSVKVQEAESAKTATANRDETLPVHPGVICDSCDDSIFGFRYKCVQCPDYDLCRHCEAKMVHEQHLMVRIPIGVERLPRKIDRVLNLGRAFENAEDTIRKCRKEETMFRREEEKHRREEEKHRRHEEKCKKKAHRRCAREQFRCPASAPPSGEPQEARFEGQNRPGAGFLYQAMDFLNYMMNPDNILENMNQTQTGGAGAPPSHHGCPMMNTGFPMPPSCPRFGADKAQEAKEKATKAATPASDAAEQERRSGFENFYENLTSSVANAVPLGTDANVMTTSIGVAAKEVEIEKEAASKETATAPEKVQPTEEVTKNAEEILREKLQEKLNEMERELEKDKKNRSSSPTISYTSEDSDEMNSRDRDWTVLDNEEAEGAAAVAATAPGVDEPTHDTGAVPKEPKMVEDKATLTDNSSSTSSMFSSAHANGNEKEKVAEKEKTPSPEKPRGKPLTFEEMGRQLKAHIDEYRNLAIPVGPPAGTTQAPPMAPQTDVTPGHYPHPAPTSMRLPANPPPMTVYHPTPHINHAIHTMEAMGFSNTGGWLTSLLDTVDGNIPRALDLLQPHQK